MRCTQTIHIKLPALGAFCISVALVACGEAEPSYFPLDSERYWQYTIERTTMDGIATQKYVVATVAPEDWDGLRVRTTETLGGHRYYYARDAQDVQLVGWQLHGEKEVTRLPSPQLLLPANLSVGAGWQQQTHTKVLENTGPPWETLFRIAAPVGLSYRIESESDTVSVPAGEFSNCLRVSAEGRTNTDVGNYIGHATINVHVTDWYAPGVGLIRSERTETTDAKAIDRGSLVMQLESYR